MDNPRLKTKMSHSQEILEAHYLHFRKRLYERYGLPITKEEYDNLLKKVRSNLPFFLISKGSIGSYNCLVTFKDKFITVIYDPKHKTLVTTFDGFLPGVKKYIYMDDKYRDQLKTVDIDQLIYIATDQEIVKNKIYFFKTDDGNKKIGAICVARKKKKGTELVMWQHIPKFLGLEEMLEKYGMEEQILLATLVRTY